LQPIIRGIEMESDCMHDFAVVAFLTALFLA
jgi:hypothetical protein